MNFLQSKQTENILLLPHIGNNKIYSLFNICLHTIHVFVYVCVSECSCMHVSAHAAIYIYVQDILKINHCLVYLSPFLPHLRRDPPTRDKWV